MKLVYSILCLLIAGTQLLIGQDVVLLNKYSGSIIPEGNISYFIDSSHASRPEVLDVSSFELANNGLLNLDFQKNNVWVYFKAHNQLALDRFYLDLSNPLLDSIKVYTRVDGENWREDLETGAKYNFQDRYIKHQHFIIPFNVGPGKQIEVIIKINSSTPVLVPLKIYSGNSIIDIISSWDFSRGLFYGIMLAMLFYNFFISISTRDQAYYYYVAYVLFIGLTQTILDGTFERYLVNFDQGFQRYLLISFPALSGIFAIQFAKVFMQMKENARRLYRGMTILQIIYGAAIVFALLGFAQIAFRNIDLAGVSASLYAFFVAIYLSFKGSRPAKLFLLAWSVFLVAMVLFVLRNVGVVSAASYSENILHIGIGSEVILLSFALADRINTLRKERQESQEEALRVSRENERIIRDQNVMLEKVVNERTEELQKANSELSVTLNDLRDTQTQLVDAEKMASLGQLTAGIAHEINNPINFVSSNIVPLSRDLEDVYEIINAYKDVEGDSIEEKLEKAHALREELDYDFVKEEIMDLVNGIKDGAERTSEIVRGLRTFSRLDEDAWKLANLQEGISSTMVLLRSKMRDAIEVIEDFDNNIDEIECYPGKLNQVFMNILTNAIYAVTHKNYENGEMPTITLKTRKKGDDAEVYIIDNGIGMDEETKKRIFEPFFTTKDVGEGTGLGMSIVYKIIEKHNGRMNVESTPGVGSEFIITLPIRQPKIFE